MVENHNSSGVAFVTCHYIVTFNEKFWNMYSAIVYR